MYTIVLIVENKIYTFLWKQSAIQDIHEYVWKK